MVARPDRPPYSPPDTVAGKYLLRRILGEGGMAVVYSAVDTTCDRQVALKILRPGVVARRPLSAAAIQREAATVVKLHDRTPHVAEVLTAGITDDAHRLPYYVMERLHGTTLRTGIEEKRALRQPFEILEVVSTVTEIAIPLSHAHKMGIVHRDVKPENVFLAEQRDSAHMVKLLDFGISALVDDEPGAPVPRVFSGSRQYASPEQLDGRPATPASDIYSLGLILYEMLTFTLPHDRLDPTLSLAQTAYNALQTPLGELRKLRDDLLPELEALVDSCLEHRPQSRPTALHVASTLRDVKRVFEARLLGRPDDNATDVTGPPVDVLLQRVELDTSNGRALAGLGSQRFGAEPQADLRANTGTGAAVTAVYGNDHEVFFENPVAGGAGERMRTDPLPQVFAPAAPASIQPQRVMMVAAATEVPPPPKTLPLPPPGPDSTARLPAMAEEQARSARPPPPQPWPVTEPRRGMRPEVLWLLLAAFVVAMVVIAMTPSLLARRAARAAAAASSSASP